MSDIIDSMVRRLQGKDVVVHVVIAARSAMRTVPMLIAARNAPSTPVRKDVLLRAFRAVSAAWVAGTHRALGNVVPQAAIDALNAVGSDYDTGYAPSYDSAPHGAESAYAAIAAAATLAKSVGLEANATEPLDTISVVFRQVENVCLAVVYNWAGTFEEIFAEADEALRRPVFLDVDCVRKNPGNYTSALEQMPLWPPEMAGFMDSRWQNLKSELLDADPNWRVWTDWYDARLQGCLATANLIDDSVLTENHIDRNHRTGPEGVDRNNRYHSSDGPAGDIAASSFKRLSKEEQIAHMVHWFHRMYEDPANETPHESREGGYIYIWGGPFEARNELGEEFGDLVSPEMIEAAASEIEKDGTLDWAPTDSNPKHGGKFDEDDDTNEEPSPPSLNGIRERIAGRATPKFGDSVEVQKRKELRNEIAELRRLLESIPPPHAEIGHNQPPEPLRIWVEVKADVKVAVEEIDAELTKPSPNVDGVVERSRVLAKALEWVFGKADKFVNAAVLSAGGAVGAGAVADLAGIPVWENVARVYEATLRWLDAAIPLL